MVRRTNNKVSRSACDLTEEERKKFIQTFFAEIAPYSRPWEIAGVVLEGEDVLDMVCNYIESRFSREYIEIKKQKIISSLKKENRYD